VKQRRAVAAWWNTWRNADISSRLAAVAKRTKRLLLEDKEDGVNELDVFDVVVDHVKGNKTLSNEQTSFTWMTVRLTGVKAAVWHIDQ
jgi:hypothetical protein